ncbi:MAG: FtsX-like permease family protein [Spirochaetales bacterium]|nr:FtsX-like permease family protein [Spirochaetales bacterium]
MYNEAVKIILRRFRDRSLESGLLIIALALGIGVFTAGLSLIMNTAAYSNEIMKSPVYKEIVVSTRGEADEMETPVSEKPARETAILTQADLDAAELAPNVAWAYVQNHNRLHLISPGLTDEAPPGMMMPTEDNTEEEQITNFRGFQQISDEDLAAAQRDSNIILSELDEISGYSVTPQFFNSWEIDSANGSLFSEADLTGTDNIIILGSDLAELLAGDKMPEADLLGKKLLSREGYQTIIGILDPVSDIFDKSFFSPYKDLTGGMSGFKNMFMNTQLRFAVDDSEQLYETASLLSSWFTNRFGENQIVISNPRAEAEQLIARNTGIGVLILFLSAAGFFIALVNVSNILMSRVLRMKKNVGILMALGSSKRGIMKLFLTEALMLAISGSIAGAVFAIPLSSYMREAAGITSGSWIYIAIGAVFAGVLTGLFGLIPSRQFMKIDPAQAMRSA